MTNKTLNQLLKDGLITKEEYNRMIDASNSFLRPFLYPFIPLIAWILLSLVNVFFYDWCKEFFLYFSSCLIVIFNIWFFSHLFRKTIVLLAAANANAPVEKKGTNIHNKLKKERFSVTIKSSSGQKEKTIKTGNRSINNKFIFPIDLYFGLKSDVTTQE